jgi:hypothetical protein
MAGLIGILVATRDHARLYALHERAQCCEIGARIGARGWQGQLLGLIGDGALLSRKCDSKQMIRSKHRFDLRYPPFYPLNACLLITISSPDILS